MDNEECCGPIGETARKEDEVLSRVHAVRVRPVRRRDLVRVQRYELEASHHLVCNAIENIHDLVYLIECVNEVPGDVVSGDGPPPQGWSQ